MVAVSTPAEDTNTSSSSSSGESFLSRLSRSVGLRRDQPAEPTTVAAASSKPVKPVTQKAKSVAHAKPAESKPAEPRVISLDKTQQAQAQPKTVFPEPAPAAPPPAQQSIAGAQPAVPSNSFDSRWSTVR
jgi:hypothetical protein